MKIILTRWRRHVKRFSLVSALTVLATSLLVPIAAQAQEPAASFKISEAELVYAANGQRLALSGVNGKLISSENKGDLLR